jgi:hypothetical protein
VIFFPCIFAKSKILFSQKLSRKFRVFVKNLSRKQKVNFAKTFAKKQKRKLSSQPYASVWKLKKNITCPPTTTGLDIGYPGPDSDPERVDKIGEYYILPPKWKVILHAGKIKIFPFRSCQTVDSFPSLLFFKFKMLS